MPYCPVCDVPFPPGSRCPEHGGLVHPLRRFDEGVTGGGGSTNDRFIPMAVAWSDVMAQSWAELLQNNGIPCLVKTGGPGWSFGGPPPISVEIYLYVPATRAERARALLEPYQEAGALKVLLPDGEDEVG